MTHTGFSRFPWYAILVAAIPPLFLWSGATDSIDPRDVLVHVVLRGLLAAGLLALFRRRLDLVRAGFATALTVVGLTWPFSPIVAVCLPILGVPLLFLLKPASGTNASGSISLFLNGLALTTALTSIVAVLLHYSGGSPKVPVPRSVPLASKGRPDVWWIVLDGLSRGDWLERRFAVPDVLGPGLEKRGFQVARSARANYPQTLYVLASALNLDYVQDVAGQTQVSAGEARAILRANVVAGTLRDAGYETVFWPGGYHRLDPGLEEVHTATFLPTEFHLASMNLWPPVGLWRMATGRSLSAILRSRFTVKTLASLHAVEDGPPTFNFLHVVAPHAPFVLGANGETVHTGNADTIMDGMHWVGANPGLSYRNGYAGQAAWVQPQVLAAVDRILAPGSRPAVIIVCSDHGSGLGLEWERVDRTVLSDRMSTLWAVRLPGGAARKVPATMSTVNTFRYVFDEVFGTSLGLLPDRSYWQTWDAPQRLTDVTSLAHPSK